MLAMLDADSLHCACRIVGLDVPEEKKGNRNLLLKSLLRKLSLKKWRQVKMGEPLDFKNFMTI